MSSTVDRTHRATAIPTATMTRMVARDRTQNWRRKYLRALNICCPTDPVFKFRTKSSQPEERRSSLAMEKETAPLTQHQIHAVPLRAPIARAPLAPSLNSHGYPAGIVMRPGMARGRRCHTDPVVVEERMSAPIQIPTGSSMRLDGGSVRPAVISTSGRHQRLTSPLNASGASTHTQLLSWEEPVAMLAAADAVSKGWRLPACTDDLGMELGVRRSNELDDALESHDEEDFDHDDDIFAMEELHESDEDENPLALRPRIRRHSMSRPPSGREKRMQGSYSMLSQSFVPPHQLVQRDCFSIGMRDEFKRRPTGNI